jgi:hypothetical protein
MEGLRKTCVGTAAQQLPNMKRTGNGIVCYTIYKHLWRLRYLQLILFKHSTFSSTIKWAAWISKPKLPYFCSCEQHEEPIKACNLCRPWSLKPLTFLTIRLCKPARVPFRPIELAPWFTRLGQLALWNHALGVREEQTCAHRTYP